MNQLMQGMGTFIVRVFPVKNSRFQLSGVSGIRDLADQVLILLFDVSSSRPLHEKLSDNKIREQEAILNQRALSK